MNVDHNNHEKPTPGPCWIGQKTSWSYRKSRSQLGIYKPEKQVNFSIMRDRGGTRSRTRYCQ